MADSVEATVRDLKLQQYVLVGHSMSGKVATVLARRAQDRKAKDLVGLILIAPSPPSPEPMTEEKREGMLASLGQQHEGDFDRARKYITRNEERDIAKPVEQRAAHEVLRMNRAAWRAWLNGGSKEDWTDRVGLLTLPALVVAGQKDASLGPDSQRKFTLPHLAQGRIEVVPNCSHLVPMERPVQLAAILSNFVRGLIR
jgi:pimeloyl-ACP methyl ester carboxylesterase